MGTEVPQNDNITLKMGIDPLKGTGTVRPLLALISKRTRLRRERRHVTVTSEECHTTLNLRTLTSSWIVTY